MFIVPAERGTLRAVPALCDFPPWSAELLNQRKWDSPEINSGFICLASRTSRIPQHEGKQKCGMCRGTPRRAWKGCRCYLGTLCWRARSARLAERGVVERPAGQAEISERPIISRRMECTAEFGERMRKGVFVMNLGPASAGHDTASQRETGTTQEQNATRRTGTNALLFEEARKMPYTSSEEIRMNCGLQSSPPIRGAELVVPAEYQQQEHRTDRQGEQKARKCPPISRNTASAVRSKRAKSSCRLVPLSATSRSRANLL